MGKGGGGIGSADDGDDGCDGTCSGGVEVRGDGGSGESGGRGRGSSGDLANGGDGGGHGIGGGCQGVVEVEVMAVGVKVVNQLMCGMCWGRARSRVLRL